MPAIYSMRAMATILDVNHMTLVKTQKRHDDTLPKEESSLDEELVLFLVLVRAIRPKGNWQPEALAIIAKQIWKNKAFPHAIVEDEDVEENPKIHFSYKAPKEMEDDEVEPDGLQIDSRRIFQNFQRKCVKALRENRPPSGQYVQILTIANFITDLLEHEKE